MVGNSGKPFENEFRASLIHFESTHKNFYWYRINDFHSIRAAITQLQKLLPRFQHGSLERRFGGYLKFNIPKSPADFFASYRGTSYHFECKSAGVGARTKTSYPFEYIARHQLENGLKAVASGNHYYFVINDRRVARKFRCYVINAVDWNELEKSYLKKGRKSIKWKELFAYKKGFEIRRLKGGKWCLVRIFNIPA